VAGVDLLEAEATEQAQGKRVVFADLGLDERKVLIVIATDHVTQKQSGQTLATQLLVDLDVQDADAVLVPAQAERVQLPDERAAFDTRGDSSAVAIRSSACTAPATASSSGPNSSPAANSASA